MAAKDTANGFRRARQRASRACEVCHARKVRCDVTIHKPCTNCVAFGCECRIPESRTRRKAVEDSDEEEVKGPALNEGNAWVKPNLKPPESNEGTIYMGSASYVPLFASGEENTGLSYGRLVLLDKTTHITREDISVLKIKGAFYLPPKDVCNDLVDAYFDKIHPILPCLNKNEFLTRYNDPQNQPPLLILQSLFCCSAHVCKNPALIDQEGTTRHATELFYKRAKALFESDYEHDRTVSMVSALLLSMALDSPDRVNNNIFYWCRVAVTLAQSLGLHRWIPHRKHSEQQKRMFRRIWWCLFVRDRSSATAYGRPTMINLEDSDVPMIEAEDFAEDEHGPPQYPNNERDILYFMQSVKLHEIMGLVLRQQYSVGAERLRLQNQLPDVTQCDIALATWINNIPEKLRYSIRAIDSHQYMNALIYLQYYTVLCLAHRPQVVHFSRLKENPYPSWGIAFQAAHMIVRIFQNMRHFDQITQLPAFCVYTSFSALIMLVYQIESPDEVVSNVAEKALKSLLIDIKLLGKVYDTAKEIGHVADRLTDGKRRSLRLVKRSAGSLGDSSVYGTTQSMCTKKAKTEDSAEAESPTSIPPKPVHGNNGLDWNNINEPLQRPSHATAPSVLGSAAHNDLRSRQHSRASSVGDFNPHPAATESPRDLYMVTQAQDQIESFEPQLLFPEAQNEDSSHSEDFLGPLFNAEKGMSHLMEENASSGQSSGDEATGTAPLNLSIVDWYDFLITNQEFDKQSY